LPSRTTPTPSPSLWDKRKGRTRQALHDAALELFAEHGYEGTTIDMIVGRAEVSPRTFFRYFASKDSVCLFGEREWMESFTETFAAQPDSFNDFDAARAALIELAPGIPRRSLTLHARAMASSPTLRGLAQAQLLEDTQIIARAVAARRRLRHPDEMCTLLAEVSVLVYQRAIHAWLGAPEDTAFDVVIAREFDLLAELFTDERVRTAGGDTIAELGAPVRSGESGAEKAGEGTWHGASHSGTA
jgi:AcrR family transcriptional regulator